MKGDSILFVAVLIIIAALAATGLFYRQRQLELEAIGSIKSEIAANSSERVKIIKEMQAVKKEKENIQKEVEAQSRQIEQVKKEIKDADRLSKELSEKLSEKQGLLNTLNEKLSVIKKQENELIIEFQQAKADYQNSFDKISLIRGEKEALEEKIKQSLSPPEGVELKRIVVKMSPPHEGRVLEVNTERDFAIVNLGAEDMIKKGDLFGIYRDGRLIGKAVVEYIFEDMSSLNVVYKAPDEHILVNDTVKSIAS